MHLPKWAKIYKGSLLSAKWPILPSNEKFVYFQCFDEFFPRFPFFSRQAKSLFIFSGLTIFFHCFQDLWIKTVDWKDDESFDNDRFTMPEPRTAPWTWGEIESLCAHPERWWHFGLNLWLGPFTRPMHFPLLIKNLDALWRCPPWRDRSDPYRYIGLQRLTLCLVWMASIQRCVETACPGLKNCPESSSFGLLSLWRVEITHVAYRCTDALWSRFERLPCRLAIGYDIDESGYSDSRGLHSSKGLV